MLEGTLAVGEKFSSAQVVPAHTMPTILNWWEQATSSAQGPWRVPREETRGLLSASLPGKPQRRSHLSEEVC
jgi:hypothetical protein